MKQQTTVVKKTPCDILINIKIEIFMGSKIIPVRFYGFVLHRFRRITLLLLVKANDSVILCRLSFKFKSKMINLKI
jgi:hypothetical protein